MLRFLWWAFSPTYRRIGTPERLAKTIRQLQGESGLTEAQALALLRSEIPEKLRDSV